MNVLPIVLLSVAAWSIVQAQPASLPPHPRLLLNQDGVVELKQRIATVPGAKAEWSRLKSDANQALERSVELPPRGGNWSHNYVCPTHGARLSQGKQLGPWQWEHICPVGRHVLRGDPSKATLDFDGNAIGNAHGTLARQCVDNGLLYQVTGDTRYADKARVILLAYAERYRTYPMHDNQGRPGRGARVASQSLSEASWLVPIAQGADLVWTRLTEADRRAIADQLLRPALDEVILRSRMGIHNIQCHLNSAIGLVGFLLDDPQLIARAIDDPVLGYRQQMAKGVLADGMWTEGSSGYHFYTISGLWPLTEAARNCGLDLYGAPLRSMFDGPLTFAMPDFVLPDFNDSGTVALAGQADHYELAMARYHNLAYVPLLEHSSRRGRLALLAGVANLPAGTPSASASRNSPASGYAILQQGRENDPTWLCVKYGPHGGGHGHPDKNQCLIYARGQILAPDGGTHAYGSPLHTGWDKATFAHNTLVVDETSQQPATGRCLAFGNEQGVDYSITDAGAIYQGVRFSRTVAMLTPQLILFVDQVQADAPHTFDLAYHQVGTWENLPAGQSWSPPPVPGYRYLMDATSRSSGTNGLALKTKVRSDWPVAITIAGGEAADVITGYGIRKTTEDRVPMLVQRRRAQQTVFIWALSLDGAAVTLQSAVVSDAGGLRLDASEAVLVHASDGKRAWRVLVNPDKKGITALLPDGSAWRSAAAFAIR
jgi:hypothetical protein